MKFFKKSDLVIIGIVLGIGLVSWLTYRGIFIEIPAKAEVYYYSELVETVELKQGVDRIFSIPQKPNVVLHQFPDGSIAFVESDCKDQICVHAGRIKTVGQFAACLPNGVVIKIVPGADYDSDDVDIVIGN